MQRSLPWLVLTGLLLGGVAAAPHAQDAAPPAKQETKQEEAPKLDSAFEKVLKGTNFNYTLEKSGNCKFEIEWSDEKRSQLIFIRAEAVKIAKNDTIATREIWSTCWKGPEQPSAEMMANLLSHHPVVGAWQMEKGEKDYVVYLTARIPSDVNAATLKRWVLSVAEDADEMEKKLTSGKDDF